MAKKVTIQDIANRLGISKSTVSKAISGATDISEATRESIMLTANEMGYRLDPEKMTRQKNAAVLVYGIHYGSTEQFGYEIIAGIQAAAIENGMGISVIPVTFEQVNSGDYDRLVIDRGFEGIFFLGFTPHSEFIKRTKGKSIPMVVLDNYIDSPLVARVGCDSAGGIRQAVTYLSGKGHTRIGFLGGEADSIVTEERKAAFADTVEKLSLDTDKGLIKYGHFSGKGTKKQVLELAKAGATAIVCISDLLAATAVKELTKAGYRVPEDISITGYDNLPISLYCVPPLTTVEQNRMHIGKTAFYTLTQIKSGIHISSVTLHTTLIERESVAEYKGGAK